MLLFVLSSSELFAFVKSSKNPFVVWLEMQALYWETLDREKSIDYEGSTTYDKSAHEKTTDLSTSGALRLGIRYYDYALVLTSSSIKAGFLLNPNLTLGLYASIDNKKEKSESLFSSKVDDSDKQDYTLGPLANYRLEMSDVIALESFAKIMFPVFKKKTDNVDENKEKYQEDAVSNLAFLTSVDCVFKVHTRYELMSGISYFWRQAKYKMKTENETASGVKTEGRYNTTHRINDWTVNLLQVRVYL